MLKFPVFFPVFFLSFEILFQYSFTLHFWVKLCSQHTLFLGEDFCRFMNFTCSYRIFGSRLKCNMLFVIKSLAKNRKLTCWQALAVIMILVKDKQICYRRGKIGIELHSGGNLLVAHLIFHTNTQSLGNHS